MHNHKPQRICFRICALNGVFFILSAKYLKYGWDSVFMKENEFQAIYIKGYVKSDISDEQLYVNISLYRYLCRWLKDKPFGNYTNECGIPCMIVTYEMSGTTSQSYVIIYEVLYKGNL